MKIWLHCSVGNETGWNAWCVDLLGFATWAPSEQEVLARVPSKIEEHLRWLESHGLPCPTCGPGVEVMERLRGDEVLFSTDCSEVTPEWVDLTVQLLEASRSDLLETVEGLPESALDWDPPYRSFASWATWRTVRQVLAHIANTETHYYLAKIGWIPRVSPAREDGDWRSFLAAHRAETVVRLGELRESTDRSRINRRRDDEWSAAKVLRRLVRHELLHLKSIRRIAHLSEGLNGPAVTGEPL